LWFPAPGAGQGTPAVTGLSGGFAYVVTVTDANGCSATQTITLVNPPLFAILPNAVITNATCGCVMDRLF